MKQCPTCQSQYTDDTLQFCLQDGSPLGVVGDSQSKTIAFGAEQETVVSNRPSGQINQPQLTNPTGWNPNLHQSNPSAAGVGAPPKKSNATMAVFATVLVMLLLFSVVGIAAWLYFRGATPDDQGNLFITKSTPYPETLSNTATNANTSSIKTTPAATRSSSSSNNANATVDNEQIKSEVAQRIDSWKSASESLDLDAHLSHYAPTVNYYNKKGASAGFVRADKQRAYSTYDSIRITLSNFAITPDASGETATAVFDKEWNFSGAQKTSSGKVQQQLQLRKINGQWLITGERDLKIYYTR